MARFEGMDELLQRVKQRLDTDEVPVATSVTESQAVAPPALLPDELYERTVEALTMLVGNAHVLRELLGSDDMSALKRLQHDHILTLLGNVLRELWSCEVALQRVPPFE